MYTSFRPQNAATRFLNAQTSNYITDKEKPVERIYGLLLYIRLFAGTPYGRVNDAGARLLHSVSCLYVRAGAAVSGCFCGCCDRSGRPSVRSAASGQQVRRSGQPVHGQRVRWGRTQSGRFRLRLFCPCPSARVSLPVQESSAGKSKVVRES